MTIPIAVVSMCWPTVEVNGRSWRMGVRLAIFGEKPYGDDGTGKGLQPTGSMRSLSAFCAGGRKHCLVVQYCGNKRALAWGWLFQWLMVRRRRNKIRKWGTAKDDESELHWFRY